MRKVTYLGIQFVHSTDSFFHPAFFDGFTDFHPLLNLDLVDIGRLTSLSCERYGGIGEPFNEQIVQHQSVQVTIPISLCQVTQRNERKEDSESEVRV